MIVDVVLAARARLGEGPLWDRRAAVLRWVDIKRGEVHRFDPATGEDTSFEAGEQVGTVAVRRSGGLVLATETGIVTCAEDGSDRERLHEVATNPPGGRFNDGKADPWGRFWAGTMVEGTDGAGAFYRLDPDGDLYTMLTGVSVSNGLGWSPDGTTMYYVDTRTGGVDAFDHDPATGDISGRRRVVEIDRGWPDGLTVDAEGNLWVALWDGWAVRRYTPDGRLTETVEVPAQRVTSCAFGGADLSTLYITTARTGLAEEVLARQPEAGSLFAVSPGVPGQAPGEWAG
ncbi:MAG: SMP-30/gluconolactonase/LRE family protein [Actinophytocola sp.]|uniref:SMP-30/gluconolactonase/LRE family protein n=1 Tax=Actinophytocola sp. TaxID=1872138 RepID=UPI001326DEC5|nr:SMP-30/gluconolactonase/LRE family protein [Actinophytocola sp.]MPZ80791.1 SMP-30/gluconolactonase/LRE family protein [Actinophytocola sp.]